MKQVIIILGGSEMSMRGRVIRSFRDLPKEDWEIIFTGTKKEFKAYKEFVKKTFPDREIGKHVLAHDLLSRIKNTQVYWEKCDKIYIASEQHLKNAIEKVFNFLGRTDGIIVQNMLYPEALNKKLIYKLYSHKSLAWTTSICIKLFA